MKTFIIIVCHHHHHHQVVDDELLTRAQPPGHNHLLVRSPETAPLYPGFIKNATPGK